MSELAEVFNILADSGTGEGEAAISRIEGEAAAAIAGLIGFAFKDSAGDVVLPQLNADGSLNVSTEDHAHGTPLNAFGTGTPAGLVTDTDIATITLAISTVYEVRFVTGSSFQACIFSLEQTDDASTNTFELGNAGAGDYNYSDKPDCLLITAGASGTQELKLIGQQLRGPLSDMRGGLCLFAQAAL